MNHKIEANGWTSETPRIPGHYWVAVPGFEHASDVENVEDFNGELVVAP